MEKYISNINELNLGNKIAGGSCSDIFEFGQGKYFKRFLSDYQDLTDPINIEFYEVIKYLSELKGMPLIIRGEDIFRSKDKLFGYSMPIINAQELIKLSNDVLVDDILEGFRLLEPDVRTLADNFVKTEDVGGGNILFNGKMYLLDLDLSLVDKRYIPDELYHRTINSLLCSIRQKLLDDARFDDVVSPEKSNEYLQRLKEICSTALNQEVKTISEMKHGYQKVKSLY